MCEDGDLRLVGGATESEGRLEVCFGKRWGTIDGHGWTRTDTQVACRQLGHPTEGIIRVILLLISYRTLYTAVSYAKHLRALINLLPTFMTLVGCYGSEDKLADCSYHEFELPSDGSVSSMDISIICDNVTSTVDPTDGMTTHDIDDKEGENGTSGPATVDRHIGSTETSSSASGESGTVYASLTISALLAVALVAVLTVVFVLWRKRKSKQR